MLRIASSNTVTLVGSNTGFADENPPSQPLGTVISAAFLNDVQENICSAIEAAGITLSDASFGDNAGYWQLYAAIRNLAGTNVVAGGSAGATLPNGTTGNWIVTGMGANATLTLPPAISMGGNSEGQTFSDGRPLRIIRADATSYTMTIHVAGSDTISFGNNTTTSFTLPEGWRVELIPNSGGTGAYWFAFLSPLSPAPLTWQEWTSAGSFTFNPPAWATTARVTMCGGGGGGGACAGILAAGASGAGSPLATFQIFFPAGQQLTVNVGAGGTAGGVGPTAGGTGGTSSLVWPGVGTVLCQCTGGAGGAAASSAAASGGATPGAASAFTINSGFYALLQGTNPATQGSGAFLLSSVYIPPQGGSPGGVGLPMSQPNYGSPLTPTVAGAGGYGGTTNSGASPGGAGAPGYVRIEV